jgi:hypothetical protein
VAPVVPVDPVLATPGVIEGDAGPSPAAQVQARIFREVWAGPAPLVPARAAARSASTVPATSAPAPVPAASAAVDLPEAIVASRLPGTLGPAGLPSEDTAEEPAPGPESTSEPAPLVAVQGLPFREAVAAAAASEPAPAQVMPGTTAESAGQRTTPPTTPPTTLPATLAPGAAAPLPRTWAELAAPANPLDAAIARQVGRAAARQGLHGAPMVVRITPPELGTVRIELVERDGQVHARISAEDEGVRQALDKMLPQLRGDLRAADSRVSEVSVAASAERGGGQQGSGDPASDGRAWSERQGADRQEQARDGGGQRGRGFSLSGGEAAADTMPAPRPRPAAVRAHQGAVDLLA